MNVPLEVLEDLRNLRAAIRGCDDALATQLEPWERKEFRQTRETAAAKLAAREAALASIV